MPRRLIATLADADRSVVRVSTFTEGWPYALTEITEVLRPGDIITITEQVRLTNSEMEQDDKKKAEEGSD